MLWCVDEAKRGLQTRAWQLGTEADLPAVPEPKCNNDMQAAICSGCIAEVVGLARLGAAAVSFGII